ncbi:hypothetical protein [Methylorubrum sp. SB2]|uniref:hypothetical protein n=1 Tax=Methylorubrum subtropicum TaxID=3138812 RepID=UPI00313B5D27
MPAFVARAERSCGGLLTLAQTCVQVWWLLSGLIWCILLLRGDDSMVIPPALATAMQWAFTLVAVGTIGGGLLVGTATLLVRIQRRRDHARRHTDRRV